SAVSASADRLLGRSCRLSRLARQRPPSERYVRPSRLASMFMKRIIALLSVGLVLVVLLASIGLRATQNDAALRVFLLPPEGCAMPCWLGIQPGMTTYDQAIEILEAHPWVGRVIAGPPAQATRIFFQWNDQAPDFADDDTAGVPTSYLSVQD